MVEYSNQLRIFYVNQSYELKNLPSFFTAIKELSTGRPSLIMHSGETLVDSSEHVRDFGVYIIQALNVVASHVPIVATFGTSVCDAPTTRRLERVLNASTLEILQTDSGLEWDAVTQTIRRANGEPFDPAREYRVVMNCAVLAGMDNHLELMAYLNETDMTIVESCPDFPAVIFRTLMKRLWSSIGNNQYTIDDRETLKADVQSATEIPVVTDRLVAMMWQYVPQHTSEQRVARSLNNGSTTPPVVPSLDASLPLEGSMQSHNEL